MKQRFGINVAHLWQIYKAHFRVWAAVELQYRVASIIWLIGTVLEPVVYLVVWTTVANSSGGDVGGYETAEFATYYIASMLINHLTFTWHMFEYDSIIRRGLLSPKLLRPLHPIHSDIAENLVHKVMTLVVMGPTAVLLVFLFQPAWDAPLWSWLLAGPATVMAFCVQFFCGWILAMAAFWINRVSAIIRVYFLGKLFLAGQIAPLVLLPISLQVLASVLPYRWMLSFPVELLVGRLTLQEALFGLVAQGVWVLLSLWGVRAVWRAGVKKYAAFGA
jgi:ABC-2 type transport system permease protein